jgi:hypothetical protein
MTNKYDGRTKTDWNTNKGQQNITEKWRLSKTNPT